MACPVLRLTKWLWSDSAGSGLTVNGGGYRVVGKDLQEDRPPRLTDDAPAAGRASLIGSLLKANVAGREVKRADPTE